MSKEEYAEKCASIVSTLMKIISGIEVSREERLKASMDSIEVLYYENSHKKNVVKEKK